MSGHYCVGVHYRDPQHDFECLYPTPRPEEFIARLRRHLPKNQSWRVFLATDFPPAVDAFRKVGQALLDAHVLFDVWPDDQFPPDRAALYSKILGVDDVPGTIIAGLPDHSL